MGYEIHNDIDFKSLCAGRNFSYYKDGSFNIVKSTDLYYNGSAWVLFCEPEVETWKIGFDVDNEDITILGGTNGQRREVIFKLSAGYPWATHGAIEVDFDMTIEVEGQGNCYINMYDNNLSYYHPRIDLTEPGTYNITKRITMQPNSHTIMRYIIQAYRTEFTADATIISGDNDFLNLGEIPLLEVYDFTV